MAVLTGLQPEKVFTFFETICGIPHGSGNTQQLSDWLVAFARSRNLEHHQDDLGNVIIIRPASPGFEQSQPVILQGHMDMVCDRAAGCSKDMATEGLDLLVEGDLISAAGTTLGGDDGIAVAYMLALLDEAELQAPRLEAVFTVEEETGLYGAEGIDVSPLQGRRFINLDSEDEGIITVGCAGGVTAIASLPVTRETAAGQAFTLTLAGFTGGHSGTDIIKGQQNPLKALGRLLWALASEADIRLLQVTGGVADNVIPTAAGAVFVAADDEAVRRVCDTYQRIFAHECKADPDHSLTLQKADCQPLLPMDADSTRRVIAYLWGTPNGIQRMTFGIADLPQTSLSLGVVRTGQDAVEFTFCIRSSVDSECQMLAQQLRCQAEVLGASLREEGPYPGWEYAPVSPLRALICQVYQEQTGKEMTIEAIHAGLECGYFAGKIPGLDCVSIGPDLRDVHTAGETMSISSVQRTWDLLVEVLRRMQ